MTPAEELTERACTLRTGPDALKPPQDRIEAKKQLKRERNARERANTLQMQANGALPHCPQAAIDESFKTH